MDLPLVSRAQLAGALLLLFTAYLFCVGVYRVYFSPVSHIPGPFLAKLTSWYQHYHNFKGGKYVWRINEMHEQYGPVVRISPQEVHVKDPLFFEEIYTRASKRNKWSVVHAGSPAPDSTLGALDHDLHRKRRATLSPFFSKKKVNSLQPVVLGVINNLMERFEGFGQTREVVNATHAFSAMGYDIICQYALGYDNDHIHAPDFNPALHKSAQSGADLWVVAQAFPSLCNFLASLPDVIAKNFLPGMDVYTNWFKKMQQLCLSAQAEREKGLDLSVPKTIFHQVLNDPNLPESEKHYMRLWQDGYIVLAGGMLTIVDAMHWITYALLSNPQCLRKLKDELRTVMPEVNSPTPPAVELEKLPYLTGILEEALRLSNGATMREPLIDPVNPLVYVAKGGTKTVIPPGTPTSSTAILMHFDPDCFPEPDRFWPERWMSGSGAPPANRKAFAPFSKGSRMCVGFHLAYAEMYLATASIFRRYGSKEVRDEGDRGWLELFDFNFKRDLEILGDGGVPIYSKDAKGVRIRVWRD